MMEVVLFLQCLDLHPSGCEAQCWGLPWLDW
jgi:hypothetical protein